MSIQTSLALCSCLLPEPCPQWGSWSLTLHLSLSLSHPWPLLTIQSAFLALSSLLIYRIMHQTGSRGDTVTHTAAPSAFMFILTTVFDQLELPQHSSLLSYTHIQKEDKASIGLIGSLSPISLLFDGHTQDFSAGKSATCLL